MRPRAFYSLIIAALCLLMAPAAAQDPPVTEAQVREAVEALDVAGKELVRSYMPFRRGAPADRAQWTGLADIYRDVGKLADRAGRLERLADRLYREDHHDLEVSRREFRRRLALADSLVAMARLQAAVPWDEGLPEDLEDARHLVTVRARAAKNLADRTAAAATDVAYGLGVTEGIGYRALALSVVGILVVFTVLSLIALVVGAIRRLDDGWKQQEVATSEAALTREPTIDATTAVLIAAACATLITGRFRVRRVRRLLSPRARRTPWSAQGRLILQGSHSVSRKP